MNEPYYRRLVAINLSQFHQIEMPNRPKKPELTERLFEKNNNVIKKALDEKIKYT